MMQNLEEELEEKTKMIRRLEHDVSLLQDHLLATQESLKETQRYLIKLAHSQNEFSKRLSTWPYLKVPASKRREDV